MSVEDTSIAASIRRAVERLNELASEADRRGLTVRFGTARFETHSDAGRSDLLTVEITRNL